MGETIELTPVGSRRRAVSTTIVILLVLAIPGWWIVDWDRPASVVLAVVMILGFDAYFLWLVAQAQSARLVLTPEYIELHVGSKVQRVPRDASTSIRRRRRYLFQFDYVLEAAAGQRIVLYGPAWDLDEPGRLDAISAGLSGSS